MKRSVRSLSYCTQRSARSPAGSTEIVPDTENMDWGGGQDIPVLERRTTLVLLRRKPLKNSGPQTLVLTVAVSQEMVGYTVLLQGTLNVTVLIGPSGLLSVGWPTAVKSKI